MKIKQVEVINYKSIKDIVIPFMEYGNYSNKSKTTFLVGLNETGKSAILESLSLINDGFSEIDYEDICFKNSLDNEEYIELYISFEIKTSSYWVRHLKEKCGIPESLANKIHFKNVSKNIYIKEDVADEGYLVEIAEIPLYEYLVENETIDFIRIKNNIKEKITHLNASSFLSSNQKLLTKSKLESIIVDKLFPVFNINIPKVQVWKPKKEYLINSVINLVSFKENPELSIPLKNIFNICGYDDNKKIKQVIERALKKQEKSDELEDKMSLAITKHLNKIWKEHKIKVVISINGNNCQVFIEDKDKKHNYFRMEQRSEGFKQFVSLILSLSVTNETNNLRNNVILIDEPEVHLHPSGIRYMRDEIIKIGKNNHVFVSTHSHYMVDTNCPERHWIVKKEKAETSINQIGESTPIEDDDVLLSAFGLNLFRELLPQNILLVEGGDDKQVISHIFRLNNISNFSIKSAGGASKAPGIASILVNESIPAFILFDDDKEGKDNKKRILEKFKESYSSSNVFTLRDLVKSIPVNSTLEDLMPTKFVLDFFNREMDKKYSIDEKKACIIQLKNQDERLRNKQKLDSLKLKLSNEFIKTYKTKAKVNKLTLFEDLRHEILKKWN
ncbi:AAA family ATPase [Flavobacteriaceae bacterium SZ-1-7]|uniref:ATP-dependent nuclease n=1 Tax=Tamlana sedimenti TaxID=3134126 RepID=UPI003126D30C